MKMLRLPGKQQQNSIRFQWLKAFLLIMIIAVFLNIVAYTFSINELEEQVAETNRSFYKQIQSKMDTMICSLEQVSLDLYLNDSALALSRILPPQMPDSGMLTDIEKMFADKDTSLSDTYRSYYFLNNLTNVISIQGFQSAQEYFDENFAFFDMSYDTWLNWMQSASDEDYILVNGTQEGKRYVLFKYPVDYSAVRPSSFISVVEDSSILKLAAEAPFFDESYFLVLNGDGRIVAANTEVSPYLEKLELPEENEGTLRRRMEGKSYMITYTTSPLNNWKYIYITPKSVYMKSTNTIKYILWGTLFISIIIELLLIVQSVKKQYMPIKKIMKMANVDGVGNEYAVLEQIVRELGDAKKQAHGAAYAQKELMRSRFISNLLSGLVMKENMSKEYMQKLDISFPYEQFTVAAFYLSEYLYLFEEDELVTQYERYDMMKTIIINIFTEIANEYNAKVYFASQTNTLACIINLPKEADAEMVSRNIVQKTAQNILKYFQVHYASALSNVVSSMEELSVAYTEAITGVEYLMMMEESYFVEYRNIERAEYDQYTMAPGVRSEVIRLIKQKQAALANDEIMKLIDECYAQQDFSPRFFRYLIYDIAGQLLGEFKQYIDEDDALVKELFRMKIATKQDIDQVKQLLVQLVDQVVENLENAGETADPGRDKWEKLIASVKQYIDENYQDYNLNVSMIAEVFEFVPAYLSKRFKESEKISILDYINMVRIHHVKQLLMETDLTLEKIAGQTGFSNISTFNRTFKKLEGITAREYKKYMLSR